MPMKNDISCERLMASYVAFIIGQHLYDIIMCDMAGKLGLSRQDFVDNFAEISDQIIAEEKGYG